MLAKFGTGLIFKNHSLLPRDLHALSEYENLMGSHTERHRAFCEGFL